MENQLTRRYRHLSYELQFAQRTINELEHYKKHLPPHCPAQKKITENLATACALRDDIKKDINEMADNEITCTPSFNIFFS